MANTIGNRPSPSIPSAAPTRESKGSAATSSDPRGLISADEFTQMQADDKANNTRNSADYRRTITLGAREPTNFSRDDIAKMSDDEVKKITPEQILGFTSTQLKAYNTRVVGDRKTGAPGIEGGMDALGPAEKKALVRKNIFASLVAEFKKEASKYDKPT